MNTAIEREPVYVRLEVNMLAKIRQMAWYDRRTIQATIELLLERALADSNDSTS